MAVAKSLQNLQLSGIKFNGQDLSSQFGFNASEIIGPWSMPILRERRLEFPGRAGFFDQAAYFGTREIVARGSFLADSLTEFETNLENLKAALSSETRSLRATGRDRTVGMLEIGGQTNRYYRARFNGTFDLTKLRAWRTSDAAQVEIRWVLVDPLAHDLAVTRSISTPANASTVVLTNPGTASALPTFVVKANGTITSFTLENRHVDELNTITISSTVNASPPFRIGSTFSDFGFAAEFQNPSGQSVEVQDAFPPVDEGTVLLRIYPQFGAAAATGNRTLFDQPRTGNARGFELLFRSSDDKFVFTTDDGAATTEVSSAAQTFASGDKVWVTARWDATSQDLFVDATKTTAGAPKQPTLTSLVHVGANRSTTNQADSTIDVLAFVNSALSDGEITSLVSDNQHLKPTRGSVLFDFDGVYHGIAPGHRSLTFSETLANLEFARINTDLHLVEGIEAGSPTTKANAFSGEFFPLETGRNRVKVTFAGGGTIDLETAYEPRYL